jgi:hypothetical protein
MCAYCHILELHHGIDPLTPELNPSTQLCLTRFFTGDFASWTVHVVNIWVQNQQIHQLFIQFINYVCVSQIGCVSQIDCVSQIGCVPQIDCVSQIDCVPWVQNWEMVTDLKCFVCLTDTADEEDVRLYRHRAYSDTGYWTAQWHGVLDCTVTRGTVLHSDCNKQHWVQQIVWMFCAPVVALSGVYLERK